MSVPMSDLRAIRLILAEKLHPVRFPEMSGGMMAFVSYVVEGDFTDPVIAEMVIKRGVVYCRHEGEAEFEQFAVASALYASWQALLLAAGLTETERDLAGEFLAHRVSVILPNPSAAGEPLESEQTNTKNTTQEQPREQPTDQSLPPGLEAIVTAHLAEHPTLTREEVLAEIRAAGFY